MHRISGAAFAQYTLRNQEKLTVNTKALFGIILALAAFTLPNTADAQYGYTYNNQPAHYRTGLRMYHLYPYQYSLGERYEPYWSYNSSYFPYNYQGDGSYYGLGYSGYGGQGGGMGGYWYW